MKNKKFQSLEVFPRARLKSSNHWNFFLVPFQKVPTIGTFSVKRSTHWNFLKSAFCGSNAIASNEMATPTLRGAA